jgi:hypothetical protein
MEFRRSKSPRKQMPSEILDAIKYIYMSDLFRYISYVYNRFELVEPVGLDENQLKDIPYENIK